MLDVLTIAGELPADPGLQPGIALATIIGADGSVPRPVGTSMLVEAAGTIRGSLTGGCVEGAVLEACREALETGFSAVHRFGYSDDDAFAVGLMCGGTIDVLVQPLASRVVPLLPGGRSVEPGSERSDEPGSERSVESSAETAVAIVARVPGPEPTRLPGVAAIPGGGEGAVATALEPLVPPEVLDNAAGQVAAMVGRGSTGLLRVAAPGGSAVSDYSMAPVDLFVESRRPPAHLVVCGANAFGQAIAEAARPLGHRITVCDPRPAFTDPAAFPGAEVVRAWPHRFLADASEAGDIDSRSMICVLTHDPKVDVPTLSLALTLDVAYVGAMGSRRSDRDRRAALREAGVDEDALARLHSPIGLGLGAVTPAEVAIAIVAETIAVREQRTHVAPLSGDDAPLHSPEA